MDLAVWTNRAPVAWSVLVTASLLEVVWLVALEESVSAAHAGYSAVSVVVAWLSFSLLAVTLRTLPAGTACAGWTGVGAAGGAVAGVMLFGESLNAVRFASLGLIVVGIAGVKLGQ